MKRFLYYTLIFPLSFTCCAVEKFNLSPLNNTISIDSEVTKELLPNLGENIQNNVNASEITNLIASFPRFRNDAINTEVSKLKQQLQSYLYAYEMFNNNAKHDHIAKIEQSYRRIQKLRKYLNSDEDEIINRYLVRIKTNLSALESSKQESIKY